jgi:osmotically-inducible protein OsmY
MNQNDGRQNDESRRARQDSQRWDESGEDRDVQQSRGQRSGQGDSDDQWSPDRSSRRGMSGMSGDDRDEDRWSRSGGGSQTRRWDAGQDDDRYRSGRQYEDRDDERGSRFEGSDRSERYGAGQGAGRSDQGYGSRFGQGRDDRFTQESGQRSGMGSAGSGSSYGQSSYGQPSGQAYGRSSFTEQSRWSPEQGGAEMGRRSGMAGRGHMGKGPKGYQRSDERIREDVCERMTEDEQLDASEITIQVSKGEVTLNGTVSDREQKRHAEDLAERVSGVKDVTNNLKVQASGQTNGGQSGKQQGTGGSARRSTSMGGNTGAAAGGGGTSGAGKKQGRGATSGNA